MKTELNVAVVGLGNRGVSLLKHCILPREGVRVAAVCDVYEDRRERAVKLAVEAGRPAPVSTGDWREILAMDEVDAVLILASWESHADAACASMRAGKYTGIEVGGAYSVED